MPVDCEPFSGLVPDQAPEATHWVALAVLHVRVELVPLWMLLGLAPSVMVGAGACTETVAVWAVWPPAPLQVSV